MATARSYCGLDLTRLRGNQLLDLSDIDACTIDSDASTGAGYRLPVPDERTQSIERGLQQIGSGVRVGLWPRRQPGAVSAEVAPLGVSATTWISTGRDSRAPAQERDAKHDQLLAARRAARE